MNMDKRYCQNRVRKRKKEVQDLENSSFEEERQFKIRRFVEDVNKFVQDKSKFLTKEDGNKISKKPTYLKNDSKSQKTKPFMKRGLFRNGAQTKTFTRGALAKQITARLDENMHQIISLGNKENECHCSIHCKNRPQPKLFLNSSVLKENPNQQWHSRESPNSSERNLSPGHQSTPTTKISKSIEGKQMCESLLGNLSTKLYPAFIRNVTNSCIKSKSIHFKGKSYFNLVKEKLLKIHLKGKKENSQELSCQSELQKSNAATSPIENILLDFEQHHKDNTPHTVNSNNSGHTFTTINFVPKPLKSTQQFLEETIGPGSSCDNMPVSSNHQRPYRLSSGSPEYFRPVNPAYSSHYKPIMSPISRLHFLETVSPPYYMCEPLTGHSTLISPNVNWSMNVFRGGGDCTSHKHFNSFLPPDDDDSPELHFYPRKMF